MRPIPALLLGGVFVLASAGAAFGQSGGPAPAGTASAGSRAEGTAQPHPAKEIPVPVQSTGSIEAGADANADATADASLKAIRDRAKKASSSARATVEKTLAEISGEINAEASAKGEALVAARVAPEFGLTGEALMAERGELDAGLGELVIAHTLRTNAKTAVTAQQLFMLRAEGYGWGQIAYGLNLRMNEVAAAVKSEAKVATGLAKADGKAATIHSSAHVTAGTNASVRSGETNVGSASSVGVGVKVGK